MCEGAFQIVYTYRKRRFDHSAMKIGPVFNHTFKHVAAVFFNFEDIFDDTAL